MDLDFPPVAGPSRSSSPSPQPLTRRGKRRKIIYSDAETEDDDYTQPPSQTDYTPKRIRLTLNFKDADFYTPISGYTTSELTDSRPPTPERKGKRKKVITREIPSRGKAKAVDASPSMQVRGGGRRPPPRRSKVVTNPRQTRSRNSMDFPVLSTETTLESISHESLLVKNEIARLGLTLRDVTGDGNCLFRALADQLWGNQKRHGELRKLVCDYLEREEKVMGEFVEPFLKKGEGFGGYVEKMRQLKTFGSHIEIQAASRVLKRDVRVIMSTVSFTIPWQTEESKWTSPAPTPVKSIHNTRSSTSTPLKPRASAVPLIQPDLVGSNKPTPGDDSTTKPSSRRQTRSHQTTSIAPDLETTLNSPSPHPLYLALFSLAEHFQSPRPVPVHDGPADIPLSHSIPHSGDQSEAARIQRGGIPDRSSTPSSNSKPNSKAKSKPPSSRSKQDIDVLMGSLPAGHGIEQTYAEGILKRVKGNMDEAIEILLDEIHLYDDEEGTSGVGSDEQYNIVEEILLGEEESASSGSGRKIMTPEQGDKEEEVVVELGEEMFEEGDESGEGFRVRESSGKGGDLVITKEVGGLRVGRKEVKEMAGVSTSRL